jgi:hypothetical protein
MTAQFAQFAHLDQSSVNDVVYAAEQYKKVAKDLNFDVWGDPIRGHPTTPEGYAKEYARAYGHEYSQLTHDQIIEIYVAAFNA